MLAIRLSRLRSVVLGSGLTVVRVNRSAHIRQDKTRHDATRHAPTRHRPVQQVPGYGGRERFVWWSQASVVCPVLGRVLSRFSLPVLCFSLTCACKVSNDTTHTTHDTHDTRVYEYRSGFAIR